MRLISNSAQLALRYLHLRKRRSILLIAGVLLSTALITGTGTIIHSLRAYLIESTIRERGNYHVGFSGVDAQQEELIRNHAAVEQAGTVTTLGYALLAPVPAEEQRRGNTIPPYRVLELKAYEAEAVSLLRRESELLRGRLPREADEIAVSETVLALLGDGKGVGSRITLPFAEAGKDGRSVSELFDQQELEWIGSRTFEISGIIETKLYRSDQYVFEGIVADKAESYAGATVYTRLSSLSRIEDRVGRITAAAGIATDKVFYNEMLLNLYGKSPNEHINRGLRFFTLLIYGIIIIATIAIIYNSFQISLIERVAQLGTIKCIGADPRQLRRLILYEAAIVCAAAVPAGLLLGFISMKLLFEAGRYISDNPLFAELHTSFDPVVLLTAVGLSSLTVFAAALLPAVKAGRVSPIEAIRGTFRSGGASSPRPSAAIFARAIGQRPRVPAFILLAFRHMMRNRNRMRVTIFSMVVSAVLFISFSGLLELTRETNTFSDPHQPEFVLRSTGEMESGIIDRIVNMESVSKVFPYSEARIDMYIPESKVSAYYRRFVDALPELERCNGMLRLPESRIITYGDAALDGVILIGESAFENQRGVTSYAPNTTLQEGDTIFLGERGEEVFRIAAVKENPRFDNHNPNEGGLDLVLSEEQFRALAPSRPIQRLYIKLKPDHEKSEVREYLSELTERSFVYSFIDGRKLADTYTRDHLALSLFFYGFMTVIVGIGILNVGTTITANMEVRRREIATLRAVGMTLGGIRSMVRTEHLLYSLYASLISALIGSGVWYLLVRAVGYVRWTVFQIPWLDIGIATLALISVSILAGQRPLTKIADSSLVDTLRME